MNKQTSLINKVGDTIFYTPYPTYTFDYLSINALGSNTFRGFHKIDKSKPGSKDLFLRVLMQNSSFIIKSLKKGKNENDINTLTDSLFLELKKYLKKNIDNKQLNSYN